MPITTKTTKNYLSKITITPTIATPILPKKANIAAGTYESKIISVSAVSNEDELVAVDFLHELQHDSMKPTLVRFRYYVPRELNKLLEKFASYGMSGSLDSVVGLEENVTLTESSKSEYLRITERQLIALPQQKLSGILSSKRTASHKPATTLLDEDDEEDDDFLDDEE